jgi:hypothetical protein
MDCVMREIRTIISEYDDDDDDQQPRQWPHMMPFLQKLGSTFVTAFLSAICQLHIVTEVILASTSADHMKSYSTDTIAAIQMCKKLSNYMMYLVTAHPDAASLLQITSIISLELALDMHLTATTTKSTRKSSKDEILRATGDTLKSNYSNYDCFPWPMEQREEVIKELAGIWMRLLIYTAGKSRTELHAVQLARGGELLTFVWLLMAQHDLGDITFNRVELNGRADDPGTNLHVLYAFHV